jgi:hypothetical protein
MAIFKDNKHAKVDISIDEGFKIRVMAINKDFSR